jgi:acid phosphatase
MFASASAQTIKHVVLISLENHGYSQVIGNPNMPYLNQLAQKGALATNFYATGHPSIPNYFRLTTGQNVTFDDSFSGTTSVDNLARQLTAVGKTWKNYAENLPYTGYLGGDKWPYVKHHNPFAYMTYVRNNSSQAKRIVPFSQLSADLAANTLPNFAFVQVNNQHNGHDCPVKGSSCTDTDKLVATDNWLLSHVPNILNDPEFQQSGLLVIWYDEAQSSDSRYGGGRIAVVFAGPGAKKAFRSATFYRHDHLLRTIGQLLGIKTFPGASAGVSAMTDMLAGSTSGTSDLTVVSPANSSTVGSPVHVVAKSSVTGTLSRMELWVDGVKKYSTASSTLDTYQKLASGSHRFSIFAINTAGTKWNKVVYATVK